MNKPLLLIFVIASFAACKNLTTKENTINSAGSGDVLSDAFQDKLDAYVAVHNYYIEDYKGSNFSKTIDKLYEIYGDPAHPKLEQEDPITFLGNNYNWGVQLGVDPALALTTKEPLINGLDAAEQNLGNQIKKTNKLLDEFLAYYKQKEYLADHYKKAAALYTQIGDEVIITDSLFNITEKQLNPWIEKRDLATLEKMKNTEPLTYSLKHSLLTAKKILNVFKDQHIKDERIASLNLEPVLPLLETLKSSDSEIATLMTDNKALAASHINTTSTLQLYKSKLDEFIGNMNALISRIQTKKAFTQSELDAFQNGNFVTDGSTGNAFKLYNDMVDEMNYIM